MADAGQIMERELSLCRRDLQPTGNQRVPIRGCPAIHFLEPIAVHVTCRKLPSRALQQRFRNWVCTAIILLHPCLNPERPETTRDSPERPRRRPGTARKPFRELLNKKEAAGLKPGGFDYGRAGITRPELLQSSLFSLYPRW